MSSTVPGSEATTPHSEANRSGQRALFKQAEEKTDKASGGVLEIEIAPLGSLRSCAVSRSGRVIGPLVRMAKKLTEAAK